MELETWTQRLTLEGNAFDAHTASGSLGRTKVVTRSTKLQDCVDAASVQYRMMQGYLACQWNGKGAFVEGLHAELFSDRTLLKLTQEKEGGRTVEVCLL